MTVPYPSPCASVFDWATFRRTKGAVKLHLLLDHDGYLPCYAVITEGRQHEVTVARTLQFPPGTILVMDRGYVDFAWFAELTRSGVFFVTRLKDNAVYAVLGTRAVPQDTTLDAQEHGYRRRLSTRTSRYNRRTSVYCM